MGTCVSKVQEDLYVRRFAPEHDQHSFTLSRKIEKQLKNQEQEDRNMIKLLLLGSGNSGKSTVMKQFKIIHKRGFTSEERRVFRDTLWKSAIEGMRSLVQQRQDYISTLHLGDNDFNVDDPRHRDLELIDPSMEPYFQFLFFRVRNDQPMYEEVIIPVAAESSPRADCTSPTKRETKLATTLSDNSVLSPLLTSSTIVLSSPPVNDRKSPLSETDIEEAARIARGEARASGVPPVALDGLGQAVGDAGKIITDESALLDQSSGDSVPSSTHSGSGSTEVRQKKKKKKKHAERLPSDLLDVPREVDRLNSDKSPGDETLLNSSDDGVVVKNEEGKLAEAGPPVHISTSSALVLDGVFQQTKAVNPQEEVLNEENGEEKHYDKKERTKTKGTKRVFESEEAKAAYYMSKQEKKKKKKKKKEKEKEKNRRRFPVDDYDPNYSGKSGGVKVFSASSVESFRSDFSKGNAAQKATAPMVTWEKMTVGRLLQKVWMDPLIQRCWALEDKSPQIEAPLGYIMNAMDRIAEAGFQPTNEDILFARKRTSGVNLLDFEAYGARFLLIDVGGQRTERKKWLAHFDIVDAVIFVVGLDQYDQVMMEDGVTNRLRDSLELFEEMCSSPWFRTSSFLLFLNKSDVFKTKIKQVPLTVCFRGYSGDPHDYDQTSKYIIKRFQQIHSTHASMYRDSQPNRNGRRSGRHATPHVYPYMTNATDTESMRFVIDTCQDILLRSEMAQWGFFDF